MQLWIMDLQCQCDCVRTRAAREKERVRASEHKWEGISKTFFFQTVVEHLLSKTVFPKPSLNTFFQRRFLYNRHQLFSFIYKFVIAFYSKTVSKQPS